MKNIKKEIKECEQIKDATDKAAVLLRAEDSFNLWMDFYPESGPWQERLKIQKAHDNVMLWMR